MTREWSSRITYIDHNCIGACKSSSRSVSYYSGSWINGYRSIGWTSDERYRRRIHTSVDIVIVAVWIYGQRSVYFYIYDIIDYYRRVIDRRNGDSYSIVFALCWQWCSTVAYVYHKEVSPVGIGIWCIGITSICIYRYSTKRRIANRNRIHGKRCTVRIIVPISQNTCGSIGNDLGVFVCRYTFVVDYWRYVCFDNGDEYRIVFTLNRHRCSIIANAYYKKIRSKSTCRWDVGISSIYIYGYSTLRWIQHRCCVYGQRCSIRIVIAVRQDTISNCFCNRNIFIGTYIFIINHGRCIARKYGNKHSIVSTCRWHRSTVVAYTYYKIVGAAGIRSWRV